MCCLPDESPSMSSTYIMPKTFPVRPYYRHKTRPPSSLSRQVISSELVDFRPWSSPVAISYVHESIPAREPLSVTDVDRLVERLMRPTCASKARNRRKVININVIGDYSWDVEGLRGYTDTAKCIYSQCGTVKRTNIKGTYHQGR